MRNICLLACVTMILCGPVLAGDLSGLPEIAGVSGGVAVVVGDIDAKGLSSLRGDGRFIVQGLSRDQKRVDALRTELKRQGFYGQIAVDVWDGKTLPLVANFANLIVADKASGLANAEAQRVLCPLGAHCVREGAAGPWRLTKKQRPDDIDDWTHFLHSAGNNAVANDTVVGPPKRMQWVAGPRYSRHHDRMSSFTALVSQGGRVFYVMDEASPVSILFAPKRSLIARDAFNGSVLWKRPIGKWYNHMHGLKSGPAQLPRKLVAVDGRVFITLSVGDAVVALDGATGKTITTYKGTENAEEIICSGGTLLLQIKQAEANTGKLMAVDVKSGKTLWTWSGPIENGTLGSDDKRVALLSKDVIVCLDKASGKVLWKTDPIKVAKKYKVNVTPTLVLYDGVVLFADSSMMVVNRIWSVDKNDVLTAFSAETGKKIWDVPHPLSGYYSAEDVLVLKGVVWVGETLSGYAKGHFRGYEVKTGKLVGEFDPNVENYWFHHRCHRGKATVNYVMSSRTGIEYIDPKKQEWNINNWVRGACAYGVMPANGLTYAPQHPCACYLESKLSGFNALSAKPRKLKDRAVGEGLQKGPAYDKFANLESPLPNPKSEDWPTFRGDNQRSGRAVTKLAGSIKPAWSAKIGGKLSTSIVAAGRVYLASIENHTVHAVDAKGGKKLWEFTAGGRVDSPPTYWKGHVLFGSADGYVYCLTADKGQLIWKFRAAPVDQRVISYDQIESVWPVHGSIMIREDTAYFVAGRSMFLDGGLHLYRLDPATGKMLSDTVLNEKEKSTGKDLHEFGGQLNMPMALPDILSCDKKYVYMHSQPFDFKGVRKPLKSWKYDKKKVDHFTTPWGQNKEFAHLFTPTGFLDDTWWHRTYWVYGSRYIGGWAGYSHAGKSAPAGRILALDDDKVYGFGRKAKYYRWTTPIEHQLFAEPKHAVKPKPAAGEPARGRRGGYRQQSWAKDIPFFARAMLLSGDYIVIAGPQDKVNEDVVFRKLKDPAIQAQLAEQAERFTGTKGGLLWVVDRKTGEKVSELKLDTIPVFDGFSAAQQRLYMSTVDGRLICFEGK
ncbi:MAG: PQQ-binding-like beta-propeller repeat protein [Phycisphaerales bacterium]|jgi:outer membrane protein assembly factor BamB|nr:PQQ-binding-like beta-propeller repeat protein [Phycisphaerales bacterium]